MYRGYDLGFRQKVHLFTLYRVQSEWYFVTAICFYIAKYTPRTVRERFSRRGADELAMSEIILGELRLETEIVMPGSERALTTLHNLAELIPLHALSEAAAEHYGQIRAKLQKNGQPIGNND